MPQKSIKRLHALLVLAIFENCSIGRNCWTQTKRTIFESDKIHIHEDVQ